MLSSKLRRASKKASLLSRISFKNLDEEEKGI
jgi:hypothetical protein